MTAKADVERSGRSSDAVAAAHVRVLERSAARSRFFELADGQRGHAVEIGDGPPLVLVHGSGPTALHFLPLLERLTGVSAIAVDRPGFGLSDPSPESGQSYREAAIDTLTAILDSLGLAETSLLGNSTGGTWSVWYALAHPERVRRLVLVGAAPLLPGTRVPAPMLSVATPPADQAPRLPPPSRESVVRSMSVFGEGETIARHLDLLDAMVAAAADQPSTNRRLAELRSLISPTGWQPALAVTPEDLRKVAPPTLLLWGSQDPLGGADVAALTARAIPHADLELLEAGHAPWLGHPDRVAAIVSEYLSG